MSHPTINSHDGSPLPVNPGPQQITERPLRDKQLEDGVANDPYPIPPIDLRQNYFPGEDIKYWISGLYQSGDIISRLGFPKSILDLGCSSGRLLRHFACQYDTEVWGCDINYKEVRWVANNLPQKIRVFQNSGLPTLPLPSESIEGICALSVFTHIPAQETAWILELKRILKPGGLLYLTIHSQNTHEGLTEESVLWPHVQPHGNWKGPKWPKGNDKVTYDFHPGAPYSAHIFYHTDYIEKMWSRYMDIESITNKGIHGQDVVVLRKSL